MTKIRKGSVSTMEWLFVDLDEGLIGIVPEDNLEALADAWELREEIVTSVADIDKCKDI